MPPGKQFADNWESTFGDKTVPKTLRELVESLLKTEPLVPSTVDFYTLQALHQYILDNPEDDF